MIAFISDIHSNTAALDAVLARIAELGADRIICLGDVIGYGPEPRETLLRVMAACELSLVGNHEHGSMFYAADFNPKARAALDWTREQLNRRDCDRAENMRLWNYLGEMKEKHREGNFLLVHGSPRDPVREYMVPKDGADADKLAGCFALFDGAQVCFVGHSHVPGVYPESGGFQTPQELGGELLLNGTRSIVNIGSVGQPRDGDPRCSFVTFDGERVQFHRVAYDIEATQRKIREVDELPDYLADRLAKGR
ncbi:MAG: metallophosphoesterase family protein [Planctomycetes bacterium]|nr:metallophosphoesterase family protein [Planctomycetota bacterium]